MSIKQVYNILRDKLDEQNRVIIIVLDEIDKLVYKSGDDVLYHLSKINDDLKNARVSVIGISNDLLFTEFLDPRVKTRLEGEKMVFPPYNADQLQDILNQRADLAFFDQVSRAGGHPAVRRPGRPGAWGRPQGAGPAADSGGDRRANGDDKVTEVHVYKAKNKMELDCVTEAIRTLPTQSKLVLMCIILNEERGEGRLTTGEVYETYRGSAGSSASRVLTQRRITDLISELDMMGIIHAKVKSFGRGGRTKEIDLACRWRRRRRSWRRTRSSRR